MHEEIELAPDPHLLESMRAVGYTVETAIADLIDNSITAGAKAVDVLASASGPTRLSIFDDGAGMDREEAMNALRLAARSPDEERHAADLGRFGLGLKTASLSQCRRLTLITRKRGVTTAMRWDLDHVAETGRWVVLEVPPEEVRNTLGWSHLASLQHGTIIGWEDLDQLSLTEGSSQVDFDRAIVRARHHCELVFHRFVSGDGVRKLSLRFNGSEVTPLDPFLRKNRATQVRAETIRVNGVALKVQAFTLPYINKMTPKDKKIALAPGALRDSQGFYIYRAGRLVIWGTWFRLNPKSEMGKLARVQVDVPNTLDHLWALDIKKSQATPPREITQALRNLATQMVAPSGRVQKFRGRKVNADDNMVRLWDVVAERDKEFRYEVNRNHPAVQRFAQSLNGEQLERMVGLIDLIEQTFPVVDAHNRLSEDGVSRQGDAAPDDLIERAAALRPSFLDTHPEDDQFIQMLLGIEPFGSHPSLESSVRERLRA